MRGSRIQSPNGDKRSWGCQVQQPRVHSWVCHRAINGQSMTAASHARDVMNDKQKG